MQTFRRPRGNTKYCRSFQYMQMMKTSALPGRSRSRGGKSMIRRRYETSFPLLAEFLDRCINHCN